MKRSQTTPEERETFVREIRLCYWKLQRLLDDRSGESGLTEMQWGLLRILAERGPVSEKEARESLGVTPADITGLSDRLERSRYLRRVRDADDHRRVLLTISESGRNAFRRSSARRDRLLEGILQSVSAADRSQMLGALTTLLEQLSLAVDRPSTRSSAPREALGEGAPATAKKPVALGAGVRAPPAVPSERHRPITISAAPS